MDRELREQVAAGAAQDAGGLDPALLGDFLSHALDAAAHDRRLRSEELRAAAELGARAAHEGVALRALVDLYLSACWRLWEARSGDESPTPDSREALAVLRAADDGVASLVEGFQLARVDLARRLEDEHREILDTLLLGGSLSPEANARAADLGLDLAGPHNVLVVRSPTPFSGLGAHSSVRRVERALTGRHADAPPLVVARGGELVCVSAAPDRDATLEALGALEGLLRTERPGEGAWQVGVGRVLPGPQGVRVSYAHARELLDLAQRLDLRSPRVEESDLAAFRLMLSDRDAARDMVVSLLGPLQGARGGAGALVETLETYYSSGSSTAETARRLHLSVRAVTYRLDRAATLLGRDLNSAHARFSLHAATLAARVLGWPEDSTEI